jgi:hypothetical protein
MVLHSSFLAELHPNYNLRQIDFIMKTDLFTSGTIFVSWCDQTIQKFGFISYGSNESECSNVVISTMHAALEPECSVECWLVKSIFESARERGYAFGGLYAAALGHHTGFRFYALQERLNGDCLVIPVSATSDSEFKRMISENLKLPSIAPGPGAVP